MAVATRKLLNRLGIVVAILTVAALLFGVVGFVWLRARLTASLAQLDGERIVAGLAAAVDVERDALGIPTLRAASRVDLARATGFVHGQERFFQMDLMRRRAAGELSELFGPQAVPVDRDVRVHRFRVRVGHALDRLEAAERDVLESYAEGVNEGLDALGAPPPEYVLLRTEPAAWKAEDCLLVLASMYLVLQDSDGVRDRMVGVMHDTLPAELVEFLVPSGTEWDAPVIGPALATPQIPGPDVFDMRARAARGGAHRTRDTYEPPPVPGSNNWAVAGARTATGDAILANDMHLPLGLPNIWFRASLVRPEDDNPDATLRVTGATLPGAPAMVVGSNGHVAWGFTNSEGDWSDVVIVEIDPDDPGRYRTGDGWREVLHHDETIHVRGAEPETVVVSETIWGPLIGEDAIGRPLALRWVAHSPEAMNFGLLRMETARDVDEALGLATRIGIPAQNFVVADAEGRIGWTILGVHPRRVTGFDGREPVSWADRAGGWDGWLDASEYPRLVDPSDGRIWTANNRVADAATLGAVKDGTFALGARAAQIRDGLRALDAASIGDMLAIQLDDRALLLERWRDLVLATLGPDAIEDRPRRAEFRRLVEENWTGRASIDSVGYRLVRGFRLELARQVFGALTAPCRAADPEFRLLRLPQWEGPLWRLARERPAHLLDPAHAGWQDQLLAAVDSVLEQLSDDDGRELSTYTWGSRNTVSLRHPLSRAVPWLSRWLDVAGRQLPGGAGMPRVQAPAYGASERMAVSPGRESDGYFHMPGGQSGHPLSPFYSAGHEAWAEGRSTPFLPGPAQHHLILRPE